MAVTQSFKDVNITFNKHPVTGDVVVSKDASAIKQAIVNLLLTNKGEKLFDPDYGSDIRSYLFEPLDYATANQVQSNIRYTIGKWEPRIGVNSIEAVPNYDDNGFDVYLEYEIRGSSIPPTSVEFFLARTR